MQQKQCGSCRKGLFFMHGSESASVTTPANGTLAFILTLNKNTKCIHQYSHIFCLLWQLFNSYSSLCKWADSLPLPIVVKWYEPLNINDWEWLIDPPTHRPPQTDRNSDRHMHLSHSFLIFLSVALALSICLTHSLANPLSHTVIHIKTC